MGVGVRFVGGLLAAALVAAMSVFLFMRSSGEGGASPYSAPQALAPIAPREFVIAPCQGVAETAPCAVIAAGGKRLLVGAPAGIGEGVTFADAIAPDRILLFSLNASHIEGLDEVRNRAWASGRRDPLLVGAGRGIEDIVAGLNAAYVIPDALAYVDGTRAGGFDTSALEALSLGRGDTGFDTGDLTITALQGGADSFAYLIAYSGTAVILADCGAREQDVETWPADVDAYVGCEDETLEAMRLGDWPLRERVYVPQE